MAHERKTELIVRHIHERHARQTRRASFMIGVTDHTSLWIGHLSVDPLRHRDLVVNIRVAIHTTRRVGPLKRRMA